MLVKMICNMTRWLPSKSMYMLFVSVDFIIKNWCNIFEKRTCNNIVSNLVWNTVSIDIKFVMKLPEVSAIEWKVCWYLKMAAFLEESSQLSWVLSVTCCKSQCKLQSWYLRANTWILLRTQMRALCEGLMDVGLVFLVLKKEKLTVTFSELPPLPDVNFLTERITVL